MPFIKPERRPLIEQGLLDVPEPGDRCYIFYKEMVEKWRANPRWATAHKIYREIKQFTWIDENEQVAQELAWQVFFNLHVMPYELKKREENGDI